MTHFLRTENSSDTVVTIVTFTDEFGLEDIRCVIDIRQFSKILLNLFDFKWELIDDFSQLQEIRDAYWKIELKSDEPAVRLPDFLLEYSELHKTPSELAERWLKHLAGKWEFDYADQ